jgi:hypothetical protein
MKAENLKNLNFYYISNFGSYNQLQKLLVLHLSVGELLDHLEINFKACALRQVVRL